MKTAIIYLAFFITGCVAPQLSRTHAPESTASVLEKLVRERKFDEAKRVIDEKQKSDPNLYWRQQLAEADEKWFQGKKEECLHEYEEFFRFYDEWLKKSKNDGSGQPPH